MPKLKYLDSISVSLSQINNLFRIFLNHLYLLSRSDSIPYEVAFDPEFQIHHTQIREENLYIQIEKQIEQLSSIILSKKFETFQIIFQLYQKDPSLKQSIISNIFKLGSPKKQVIQEFLLHVTVTSHGKNSTRGLGNTRISLKRKLGILLKYIENNRGLFNKIKNVSALAYIKTNF